MNLTIGGLPGTGTSTLCRLLAERLPLTYTYAGQLFRDEAAARNLSLAEFGALCQKDPAVDQALDDQQVELLRAGGALLEGRLSGWLAKHHGIAALTVWVTCDDSERIRRLVERDGGDAEAQAAAALAREASEADRYQRYYGANPSDASLYDLVLDSTSMTPQALADAVIAAWEAQ